MKWLTIVLLLPLLSWAQQRPASPSAAEKPQARAAPPLPLNAPAASVAVDVDEGSVSDHVYTSDYFRFRYRFPEELSVKEDLMEGQQDESRRSFVLFAGGSNAQGPGAGSVIIFADNAKAAGATEAGEYVRRVTREVMQRQGFTPAGAIDSRIIGGARFARADFAKENTAGTVMVTMRRGYAINFVLMARSRAEVDALIASLTTLKFLPPPGAGPAVR